MDHNQLPHHMENTIIVPLKGRKNTINISTAKGWIVKAIYNHWGIGWECVTVRLDLGQDGLHCSGVQGPDSGGDGLSYDPEGFWQHLPACCSCCRQWRGPPMLPGGSTNSPRILPMAECSLNNSCWWLSHRLKKWHQPKFFFFFFLLAPYFVLFEFLL